jgi:hypothetical protein
MSALPGCIGRFRLASAIMIFPGWTDRAPLSGRQFARWGELASNPAVGVPDEAAYVPRCIHRLTFRGFVVL